MPEIRKCAANYEERQPCQGWIMRLGHAAFGSIVIITKQTDRGVNVHGLVNI